MRPGRRARVALMSLAVALSLAGCGTSSTPDFDPTGLLDFLDTKKPLPGERKPVFPEGVPGVERGVPKELTKGYQQQAETPPDQPAETEKQAAPEKPKPVKKAAVKKKPAPRVQPQPAEDEAPPAAQRPASPQQPAASPFPAPLPSGSFSR